MRPRIRRRISSAWFPERLEIKSLPSAGVLGLANVIRDLGPISSAAASRGVEATAQIDSGSAVTFQFAVEAPGNYTLLVRHTGAGLGVLARTPAGTVALDPGPAGPFQTIALSLAAGRYEVIASARGGQPVNVDWELLLTSGVGQVGATAAGASVPSVAIPGITASSPPGPSSSATVAPGASAEPGTTPGSVAVAVTLGQANPRFGLGDLVGRAPWGSLMPPNGGVSPESLDGPALGALEKLDASLLVVMQPGAWAESAPPTSPGEPSWLEQIAAAITPTSAGNEAADLSAAEVALTSTDAEPGDLGSDEATVSLASMSPGLTLGALGLAIGLRSRRNQGRNLVGRGSTRSAAQVAEYTVNRLQGIFHRSYRRNRCQPVRPLRTRTGTRR